MGITLFILNTFFSVVNKYGGAAIAFVTGSKTGMIVGIIVAIVIVVIIALCIRQAVKGLKEAKERALIKLGALLKKEESVELPDATLDMELAAVQPASGDKKKLVRNAICQEPISGSVLLPHIHVTVFTERSTFTLN